MSDQDFGTTPSGQEGNHAPAAEASWGAAQAQTPPTGYAPPPPGYAPPPPGYAPPPPGYAAPAAEGLSENSACALAYVTFIPAIIFLVMAPYNQNAKIRFHAIQEIGLSIVLFVLSFFLVIPILGLLIYLVGGISVLVLWIMCIMKASQGGAFKLPVIGNFAAQQSGYRI
jgi:uncharacterized membrane protein